MTAGQVVVIMGVTGSGKSTVADLLAKELDAPLIEGDEFHSKRNIQKMTAGIPLNDEDRMLWLQTILERHTTVGREHDLVVVSCSALKHSYRNILRSGPSNVVFVHLVVSKSEITERLSHRREHFMPKSLVDSQFDTLEQLHPDEQGFSVDGTLPRDEIVLEIVKRLSLSQ